MADAGIEALKGSWDHVCEIDLVVHESIMSLTQQVDDENFDEFMKELGVGWAIRMAAKAVKPRLTISHNDGQWTIKSESTFKTVSCQFTPSVEFDETTPDGRDVKVLMTLPRINLQMYFSFLVFRRLFILKVING